MASNRSSSNVRLASSDDEQVDIHRYLAALSRSKWLIAAIVIVCTGATLFLSLIAPETYKATATVALTSSQALLAPPDSQTQQRELATVATLLGSQQVLSSAAQDVGGGLTEDELRTKLKSATDSEANIIYVQGFDADPQRAADIANSVAKGLLKAQAEAQRSQFDAARDRLLAEAKRLQLTSPNQVTQIQRLRQEADSLTVQGSLAGSNLQIASPAEVPTSPNTPRPRRNTALAFFASLFMAVLIALARDQLRPKVNSPRELSRLTDLPVLAGIPYVGGLPLLRNRFGRRAQALSAAEHESYQSLQSSLRFALGSEPAPIVLVTSAVHGEGKTTVTARLGRALAHAGHKTLLIGADLRFPNLHQLFGLSPAPGLANILELAARTGTLSPLVLPTTAHAVYPDGQVGDPEDSNLHVLTSGSSKLDPSQLLSPQAIRAFLAHARSFDYRYILIDSAPLLGIGDTQALINEVDKVVVVHRLDRVTTENVLDTEEVISRLGAEPLGLIVIGARSELSPYYMGARAELVGSGMEQARRS
jgi:Mrp family chromosome partitioning ATPase/capsular polysaccharide biosynthesis protein